MWDYSKEAGWKPIEDFIEAVQAKDSEKKWEACGFNSYADFAYGDRETIRVTVMRRRHAGQSPKPMSLLSGSDVPVPPELKPVNTEYNFIVVIQFGGALDKVAIRKLPELFQLLRDVIPLTEHAKTTLKPTMSLYA
jgi:hypothetical protein